MSQPGAKDVLKETVLTLFRAENGPGTGGNSLPPSQSAPEDVRRLVDRILATDYLPIVRGRGQVDANREDTIAKVAAGSPGFVRHVDRADIQVDLFMNDQVAIVRSLLPTTDSRTAPVVEASYRNLHVFLLVNEEWRCVAWQVTRVQ